MGRRAKVRDWPLGIFRIPPPAPHWGDDRPSLQYTESIMTNDQKPLRITTIRTCATSSTSRGTEIMPAADARELRQRIQDGQVLAFVSEASVFIECLSLEDKLVYLAAALTKNVRPQPNRRRVAV